MGSSDGKVTIETDLDVSSAKKEIKQLGSDIESSMEKVSKKTNKATDSLEQNKKAIKDDSNAIKEHSTSTKSDTKETEQNNKSKNKSVDTTKKEENATRSATQRLRDHKDELSRLRTAYVNSYVEKGKDAKETQELEKKIKQLTKQVQQEESAIDNANKSLDGAKKEIKDVGSEADKSSSKLKNFGNSIGNIAKSAGALLLKGTVATIGATTAAIAGLTAQATTAYATYEQMVGGVETLFGAGGRSLEEYAQYAGKSTDEVKSKYNSLMSAQETVMKNAANAYRTAGISANEYMEQVTSFSASLVQSLSGDTEKAAEYADRALIDMSDNANKMGTDMESIQNAYQGFAKQNYTMLDNLKLGYGGTKTEMERLIADASELVDIQEKLGVTVESGDLSFGNIVNAISVIQSYKDISGTTLKEAEGTIEGSTKMMKASWDNLVVGIADDTQDFDQLIDNFVSSTTSFFVNMAPRIEKSIGGIGRLVESLAPVVQDQLPVILSETLPNLIDSVTNTFEILAMTVVELIPTITDDVIPVVISSALIILSSVLKGIKDAMPSIFSAVTDIISQIAQNSNDIFDIAFELIATIIKSISSCLPQLTESAVDIINQLAISMDDNLPIIINVAVELIQALADSLEVALPILIDTIPILVEACYKVLHNLIVSGNTDIVGIVIQLLTTLIKNIPNYLYAILQSVVIFLGQLVMTIIDTLTGVGDNIYQFGLSVGQKLRDSMSNIPEQMRQTGNNIVQGLWTGISNGWSGLTSKVNNLCQNLIKNVKSVFNIHSPSKEFEWIGKMNAQGMTLGFDKEDPMKQIANSLTSGKNTLQDSIQSDNSSSLSNLLGSLTGNNTNINVVLEGDAKQLFRMVRIENNAFKKATGSNAFA